ncbi:hypothetical protein U9M48_036255, partial [Paspalum notatum var. saurae]
DGFNRWWHFWRPHLFHNAVASALLAIDPEHETTQEEDPSSHSQEQERVEEENSLEPPSSSPKDTSGRTDEARSTEVSPPQTFDAASLLNFDASTIGESLVTESPPTTFMTDVTSNLKEIAKQLEAPIEKLVVACDGIRTALKPIIDKLPSGLKQVLRPTAHLGFLCYNVLAATSRIASATTNRPEIRNYQGMRSNRPVQGKPR